MSEVLASGTLDADEVLALAASVEASSEHPLAKAIVAEAAARSLPVARAESFASLAGRGAEATVDGRRLTVASRGLLTERGLRMDPELVHAVRAEAAAGQDDRYSCWTGTRCSA